MRLISRDTGGPSETPAAHDTLPVIRAQPGDEPMIEKHLDFERVRTSSSLYRALLCSIGLHSWTWMDWQGLHGEPTPENAHQACWYCNRQRATP